MHYITSMSGMEDFKNEVRRGLILCLPYILVIFFLDDLDRFFFHIHSHFGTPLLALYIIIITVLIGILFLNCFFDFREHIRLHGYKHFLLLALYFFTLLDCPLDPLHITREKLKKDVMCRASMHEEYGISVIRMRNDRHFDVRYQGPLAMSDWRFGQWDAHGDTFYLHFDSISAAHERADPLSDSMVLTAGYLRPMHIPQDTVLHYKRFFFKMLMDKRAQRLL